MVMQHVIPMALQLNNSSTSDDVTMREALSGISGSISMSCWIFLIIPQLIENYRNSSAEGLSPSFLIVWLLGDICNVFGAILARLLPTMIAIGFYFVGMDVVMLGQLFYYKVLKARWILQRQQHHHHHHHHHSHHHHNTHTGRKHSASMADRGMATTAGMTPPASASETDPLLSVISGGGTIGGSDHRRRSSASRRSQRLSARERANSLSVVLEEKKASGQHILLGVAWIGFVVITGALGWYIAYKTNVWNPAPDEGALPLPPSGGEDDAGDANHGLLLVGEVLGYASSAFYLTARLPQIYHNYSKKSCEGLSVLFFVLSIIGNGTYGASILFHSTDASYLSKNAPWLLGSLGTIAQDILIFVQFKMYSSNTQVEVEEEAVV